MRFSSLVLYGSVAASIGGAFFAGRYVGAAEANLRSMQVEGVLAAANSSEALYIAGSIAEMLKTGRPGEALTIAEQYARLKAPAVSECLAMPSCTFWAAASEDRRTHMNGLLSTYGAASAPVPAK